MSSPSSAAQNGQPISETWKAMASYAIPPVSAGGAIFPAIRGFIVKTQQQIGKDVPPFELKAVILEGVEAAPKVAAIVGTQMVAQGVLEKILNGDPDKESSFSTMFVSTGIVSAVSAPPSAAFNGQTMGKGVVESIKGLTVKQTGAVMVRDLCMLFSLRVSEPLAEEAKKRVGDNQLVASGTAYATGWLGAFSGHHGDTVFTLLQKKIEIINWRDLWKGARARANAVGIFTVGYNIIKDKLNALNT